MDYNANLMTNSISLTVQVHVCKELNISSLVFLVFLYGMFIISLLCVRNVFLVGVS